jgi:DNA polymerase V
MHANKQKELTCLILVTKIKADINWQKAIPMTLKTTRGGKRKGAGRKPASGKYTGAETKTIRVPKERIEEIEMLLQFPEKLKPEPDSMKVDEVFLASMKTRSPQTMYSTLVAAGLPSPTEDYSEGKVDLNEHLLKNPDSTFFVRVSGESMIDVGIHPGDLLIVDRSLRPSSGRIIIAVINGELTVKRLLKKDNNKLFLMPENANYPAIEITEAMEFMIWGVVTNVIHDL